MIRLPLVFRAAAKGASCFRSVWRGGVRGIDPSVLRALEAVPLGVFLLDDRLAIRWRNSSARAISGDGNRQGGAVQAAEAFHPDDARLVEEHLRPLLDGSGLEARFDVRISGDGGESLPVECIAHSSTGRDGMDGILLLFRDVSDRVVDRDRLDAALDLSRRKLADKNRTLAVIGHEIRTPLQALESALRMQADPSTADGERKELLDLSMRSAGSLLRILDDLLELARAEADVAPVRSEHFDPMGIARDMAALFGTRVKARGGSVKAVQDGRNLPVQGDPARIRQILANLVGNAVRHAGGSDIEIVYRSRPGADGRVLCHWEIRDRGPGLSPQEAEDMFRMWHRGSESAGSGLGLAIVQGLVEVMGGSVEANARTGGGLSVHVRLPLDASAEPAAPPPGAIAFTKPKSGETKVLVAEDDRTNQIVIRRQLENLGCIPTVVADGQEALDAMGRGSFDMVLLDCQMPVLDGYATCREIRRLETENGTSRLPVLAVTAWAMQSDKDRCFESGMDQVLTKPLRAADLAEALRKWLPKSFSD